MLKALCTLNRALGNCIDSLIKDIKYYQNKDKKHNKEVVRILTEIEKVDELKILNAQEKVDSMKQICRYYKDFYEDKIIELDVPEKQI